MANCTDPDETPCHLASDLGLHCLLKFVCSNTYGYHGIGLLPSRRVYKLTSLEEINPDSFLVVLMLAVKYWASRDQVNAMPISVNPTLFRQKWDFQGYT